MAEVVERAFRGAEFLYTLKLPSGARLLCLAAQPSHTTKRGGSASASGWISIIW
jgi:hypothetical protein